MSSGRRLVVETLRKFELDKFGPALIKNGYDDIQYWPEIGENELAQLGIVMGFRFKWVRMIRSLGIPNQKHNVTAPVSAPPQHQASNQQLRYQSQPRIPQVRQHNQPHPTRAPQHRQAPTTSIPQAASPNPFQPQNSQQGFLPQATQQVARPQPQPQRGQNSQNQQQTLYGQNQRQTQPQQAFQFGAQFHTLPPVQQPRYNQQQVLGQQPRYNQQQALGQQPKYNLQQPPIQQPSYNPQQPPKAPHPLQFNNQPHQKPHQSPQHPQATQMRTAPPQNYETRVSRQQAEPQLFGQPQDHRAREMVQRQNASSPDTMTGSGSGLFGGTEDEVDARSEVIHFENILRNKFTKPCPRGAKYCPKCVGTGWMHESYQDCTPSSPSEDRCYFCKQCDSCGGTGVYTYAKVCSTCEGVGFFHNTSMEHKLLVGQQKCMFCKRCSDCAGRGTRAKQEL